MPGSSRLEFAELIRQFDRDGDGLISRKEVPERMKERWERIDTNRDGYVTLEELKARDTHVAGGEIQSVHRPRSSPNTGGAAPHAITQNRARLEPAESFSLITLGTGSPQYDPNRSGPSLLVQYQGRFFLVDMGNGTQARLYEAGISLRQIEAILLTHHHLDHNEEFIPILLLRLLRGGNVDVIGPPGTEKLVNFGKEFYAEDLAYRLGRLDRTGPDLGCAVVREVKGGETFNLGNVRITTAKVNHSIYTVAYRFDADGRSIVISGDLSYSESLVELARNADVLVMDSGGAIVHKEAALRTPAWPGDDSRRAARSGVRETAHGSLRDVSTMAQRSGAKKLVLVHIAPGEVDEEATRRAIAEIYKGEVIVARDLMEVTLTANAALSRTNKVEPSLSASNFRVYVNAANINTRQDGRTWVTAFSSLQAGIDAAAKQGGGEVWVAKGTYKPTTGTDRNASIQLRAGVAVYGGFAGTETERDQRDWERNPTILSGDIGKPGDPSDNSYHVVSGADDAVLDGFIITGGG